MSGRNSSTDEGESSAAPPKSPAQLDLEIDSNVEMLDRSSVACVAAAPIQDSETRRKAEMDLIIKSRINVLQQMQKKKKFEESVTMGIPYNYLFSLDDPYYTDYFYNDLPLATVNVGSTIKIEISTEWESVNNIDCIPLEKIWQDRRENVCQEIEKYVLGKGESTEVILPKKNQIFLVKWPSWREIDEVMTLMKGKVRWKTMLKDGTYKRNEAVDERMYQGRWFRGLFLRACSLSVSLQSCKAFWFLLVDLGKEVIVPREYVHKPTCRFMVPPQFSLNLGLLLDHETQYTDEVNKKWKYLLKPGFKLLVQPVCESGDTTFVHLVEPSETQLNAQYSHYLIYQENQEIKTLRYEIEDMLMTLVNRNNFDDVNNSSSFPLEFCQNKLDQLKEEYIEKIKTERNIKKYSAPGMFPHQHKRLCGGYSAMEFSVVE